MDVNLKDQDFLLVKEKGSNELHVANVDKNGKVKSAKLNEKEDNPDLLKIDKHGNMLENFFENFMRQVKNPTRFEFFRVPAVCHGFINTKGNKICSRIRKKSNKSDLKSSVYLIM